MATPNQSENAGTGIELDTLQIHDPAAAPLHGLEAGEAGQDGFQRATKVKAEERIDKSEAQRPSSDNEDDHHDHNITPDTAPTLSQLSPASDSGREIRKAKSFTSGALRGFFGNAAKTAQTLAASAGGATKQITSVTETAQSTFRSNAAKTAQVFAAGADSATKTFTKAKGNAEIALRDNAAFTAQVLAAGADSAGKSFAKATSNAQATFQGLAAKAEQNMPEAVTEAVNGISDFRSRQVGERGLCSWCAKIPLNQCFTDPTEVNENEAYISWSSDLTRIIHHGGWCELCGLILEMLCREQHDPVMNGLVQNHIKEDFLKGLPFRVWLSKGFIRKEQYWPFGRTANPEASPAFTTAGVYGKRLVTSSVRYGPQLIGYAKGNSRTRRTSPKPPTEWYPISVVVIVTIATARTSTPGLLWVDVMGCNGRAEPDEEVLSHFLLQAVLDNFSFTFSPQKPLTYGQILDPHRVDLSTIKLWLKDCEFRHGEACSEHGWKSAMRGPGFLRFIDVVDAQLVEVANTDSTRYVALSYVWGGSNTVTLTSNNLAQLCGENGLKAYMDQLPRTIVDAMEVVRETGERFLWCDALCILQDDPAETLEQIKKMDLVYSSAIFTIVAASGDNANAGLQGVQLKHFARDEAQDQPRQIRQLTAPHREGVSIIAPNLHVDAMRMMSSTGWNSRAWTFQEQMLSRRLLVFTHDEMMWHCRTLVAHEDVSAEQSEYPSYPLQWLSLKPQHLGIGVDPRWKDGSFEITRHGDTHLVRSDVFVEYAAVIKSYSGRSMTHEKDAINALAGLLRIFSLAFESEFIAGLPARLLDVALMWRPLQHLQRRDKTLGFPSWSWASNNGSVAYGSLIRVQRDSTGQTIDIEGIRPLLSYFVLNEANGMLTPLNGTSHGIPLGDTGVPLEWEAHNLERWRVCPDLFELDPRVISSLTPSNLIFRTSCIASFELVSQQQSRTPAEQIVIFDETTERMYIDLTPDKGVDGEMQLLLLAEAVGALFTPTIADRGFDCYAVMLVKEDVFTGIAERVGLGTVLKSSWRAAAPQEKLVCLG